MKYKLVIPEEMIPITIDWVKEEEGEVRLLQDWVSEIRNTGWLVEVKEPMTKEEAWNNPERISEYSNHANYSQGWKAGRANLLLEQTLNKE